LTERWPGRRGGVAWERVVRAEGVGRVYLRRRCWWIKYWAEGKEVRESVAVALDFPPDRVTRLMARHLLERRLTALGPGRWLLGRARTLTVGAVLARLGVELGTAAALSRRLPGRVRSLTLGELLDRFLLTERVRPRAVRGGDSRGGRGRC